MREAAQHTVDCAREMRIKTGRGIVWTNGCFDLFHEGHLKSLYYAQNFGGYGQILIVGVNSDASVQSSKGSRRPIIPEHQRLFIVRNQRGVNDALIFDDPTPCAIIAELKPDIFVKGMDWKDKDFPERAIVEAYGGRVEFVDSGSDVTTTGIIERCWQAYQTDKAL